MAWRLRWQVLIALLGVALVVALLGNLAYGLTTVIIPDPGGSYVEGVAGQPRVVNPLLAQTDADRDLVALIFDGLTMRSASGEILPQLSRSWTLSPDGLTYEFELRQDVRWHDGVPFTADDVVFTFRLTGNPSFSGPPDLVGLWRQVQVEKLDDYHVRFRLEQPFTPFIDYTTLGILPAHLLQQVPPTALESSPFNFHPIGTGPWKVEELSAAAAVLARNETYHGRHPLLERVELRFYPNSEAAFAAYEEGEIDGLARVLPGMLQRAREAETLNLYSARLAGYTLVFLNHEEDMFKDPRTRQALMWAIDRRGIIDEVLSGQGIVAHSPILPGSWAYDASVTQYDYDPGKARDLLEEAGWKDEDGDGVREREGQRLQFVLHTNADPEREQVAQALVEAWAEVGVAATVRGVDDATLVRDQLRPRQFQAVLFAWRNLPSDPDPYPMWHSTQASEDGQNYGQVKDRHLDELIEQARRVADREERAILYAQFQRRFADTVPALLLYYPVYTYAVDERVREVQIGPLVDFADRFRSLPNWYVKIKRVMVSELR